MAESGFNCSSTQPCMWTYWLWQLQMLYITDCFTFSSVGLICRLVCLFPLCRMEKHQWRPCIHGRTEPRVSCATSARTSPASRAQHIPVSAGNLTWDSAASSVGLSGKKWQKREKSDICFFFFSHSSHFHSAVHEAQKSVYLETDEPLRK